MTKKRHLLTSTSRKVKDLSDRKPALRISHIVYGRTASGGRVRYLVDPAGRGDERAIPERVVLLRWRKRRSHGLTFSGARLRPTVWRALPILLGQNASKWAKLSLYEIAQIRAARLSTLRKHHLVAPSAEVIRALCKLLGPRKVAALVARHRDRGRQGRSGVPDLFLYARDRNRRPSMARFVEVKKPKERVSPDQCDEIRFLKSLRLKARVLRLIERKGRS